MCMFLSTYESLLCMFCKFSKTFNIHLHLSIALCTKKQDFFFLSDILTCVYWWMSHAVVIVSVQLLSVDEAGYDSKSHTWNTSVQTTSGILLRKDNRRRDDWWSRSTLTLLDWYTYTIWGRFRGCSTKLAEISAFQDIIFASALVAFALIFWNSMASSVHASPFGVLIGQLCRICMRLGRGWCFQG